MKEREKELNKKLKNFPGNKYYRVYIETDPPPSQSKVSLELHTLTGLYADDYILPVRSIGEIFTIISDESEFRGHSGVGIVIMPYVDRRIVSEQYEQPLESLCRGFGLEKIHFQEIFGQNSLENRRPQFLQEFMDIVCNVNMWSIAFSAEKTELTNQLTKENFNDSELYFNLFWNIMDQLIPSFPENSICHLYFEQENNLSINLAKLYLKKLYDGLSQVVSPHGKYLSICRHPSFYSKKALYFSSLVDLSAYSNTFLQQKLDNGVPLNKIRKNHGELIDFTHHVFKNYTSMYTTKNGAAQIILGEI